MKTRLVIFDLDGTLVDSLDDIRDAMNHVLAELGLPGHSRDAYQFFVGEGVVKLVERAIAEEHAARRPEAVAAFREYYAEHLLGATHPYPGIPELLATLSETSLEIAVLSNKPHELTRRVVGELLADVPFAAVLGRRDGVALKPDPGSALEIADKVGVPPEFVAFVGDTPTDMKTAAAAGMDAFGVSWGFRPRADLLEEGALAVLESPAELVAALR